MSDLHPIDAEIGHESLHQHSDVELARMSMFKRRDNDLVPHEYFCHAHLLIALKNSLSPNWSPCPWSPRPLSPTDESMSLLLVAQTSQTNDMSSSAWRRKAGSLRDATSWKALNVAVWWMKRIIWMIHYHYGLVPETDIHHHARSEYGQSVHVIVASHVNDPAISQTVRKFYYAAPDSSIAWTSLD